MTTLKWLAIVVGVLAFGFIALRAYFGLVANPSVAKELHEDPQGERAGIVMLLTLPGDRVLRRRRWTLVAHAPRGRRSREGADPRRDALRSSPRRAR